MNVTQRLKQALWREYGSRENPAEWDGNIYGGGKLSQRFWEYFVTIEYLDLDEDSVVLDIGGGSPTEGCGFFANILRRHVRTLIVLDSNADFAGSPHENVHLVAQDASEQVLTALLSEREVTHVSCVSVLEHIDAELRRGIIAAVDECFRGACFVATYEYHPTRRFFDQQLTTRTVSEMFSAFERMHLERYSASPTLCENALETRGIPLFGRFVVPRWYPVAVKFVNGEA